MDDSTFSLKGSNLKCLGEDPQGFDVVRRINVIVGRNNSGKSSLLDLVRMAIEGNTIVDRALWNGGNAPAAYIDREISAADLEVFPRHISGGALRTNHYDFGQRFAGATASCRILTKGQREIVRIFRATGPRRDYSEDILLAPEYLKRMASLPQFNPLQNKVLWTIGAERNIAPEMDQHEATPDIKGNGVGATNALQQFLNKAELPRELVRETLLGALNEVFRPDSHFGEILCRQLADGSWEVFLSEKDKGLVALSQSGSGLKTVILALCFIHLAPKIHKKPLAEFVLAFEELENNLHPALQRRLISYLAKQAEIHEFRLFLTTHSSVAIDLLNRRSDTEIVHITHNGKHASCRSVRAFIDNSGVLDDLDVRASDLLQANGIVWVEGPSDRIYITRWIDLWSHGELVEGNHYQCIFYGGRLLSHLSAIADGESTNDGVAILRVNRNACVVMDSDRRQETDELNSTKQRIIEEMEAIGGATWVTHGREIENYVPFTALQQWAADKASLKTAPKRHDSIFEYLDHRHAGLGRMLSKRKHVLAEALCALTSRDQIAAEQSLSTELSALCGRIRLWNKLPEPTPPTSINS